MVGLAKWWLFIWWFEHVALGERLVAASVSKQCFHAKPNSAAMPSPVGTESITQNKRKWTTLVTTADVLYFLKTPTTTPRKWPTQKTIWGRKVEEPHKNTWNNFNKKKLKLKKKNARAQHQTQNQKMRDWKESKMILEQISMWFLNLYDLKNGQICKEHITASHREN